MIEDDYTKVNKKFVSNKTLSPVDLMYQARNQLYVDISQPLKKLKADVLVNTIKNCYPEKHLISDFTNTPQIELCRKIEEDKLLGAFKRIEEKHRDSDTFKFIDC